MSIHVRTYNDSDREACRALNLELTQRHRDMYGVDDIGADDPKAEFDEHLERVSASNIFVALAGERVVGFAGLIEGDAPELEPIVVTEDARGQGVGQALIAAVFAAAKERGIKRLMVRPVARNDAALRLFAGAGFRTLGQVELFAWLGDGGAWARDGATLCGVDLKV